jgi:hypothetical protein
MKNLIQQDNMLCIIKTVISLPRRTLKLKNKISNSFLKIMCAKSKYNMNHSLFRLLFLLLGLSTFQELRAQQTEKKTRWEIGVDALSLIDKNELPVYSLFGRFLINPQGNKKTQLRTRFGLEGSNYQDSVAIFGSFGLEVRAFSVFASVGIQRDIMVFQKGALYVGGDLGFSRYVARSDFPNNTISPQNLGFDNFTESKWRFSGVLGYTHRLGKNLALSFESSLQSVKTRQEINMDYVRLTSGLVPEIVKEQRSIEIWHTTVQPFYQLLLTYNF